MAAIQLLKDDVRQGRVDLDRLIDVIVSQQRQLEAARQGTEEREKKLGGPSAATPTKVDQPFSMRPEKARVVLHGVHQDADTLKELLNPESFGGLGISDDAAVYANFRQSQKCWAHLLRKAIKLTLQEPDNQEYRQFTDRLLEIYRSACRVQRDGCRSAARRQHKVAVLDDGVWDLCVGLWMLELPPLEENPENNCRLLCNEGMKLMLDRQLFTLVTAESAPTPNGQNAPVIE